MGEPGFRLHQRLVQLGQLSCHICLTVGKPFPGCVRNGSVNVVRHGPDHLFFPLFQGDSPHPSGHAGILRFPLRRFPCGLGLLQLRLRRCAAG